MHTKGMRHLRITAADWQYDNPLRKMPFSHWRKYHRFLLREHGFNPRKPIFVTDRGPSDYTMSQPMEEV